MNFFLCSFLLLNSCVSIALIVKQLFEGNTYWYMYPLLVVGILTACVMTAFLGAEFVLYKLKQAKIVDEDWEKVIEKGE